MLASMTEPSPSLSNPESATSPKIPGWVTRIIQRHAHDLRNHLHALELDATLLEDLPGSAERREAVARMRDNLLQLNSLVKSLTVKFDEPDPVVVAAADLLQLWKYKVAPFESPSQSIEWSTVSESRSLTVNTGAALAVLSELTLAAWKRAGGRPLRAALRVTADGTVSLQLREPANDKPLPEHLIEDSARFIAANDGRLEHGQDRTTREWLTTLTFNDPRI